MMDNDDLQRLPTIIRGWTWCFGILVTVAALSAMEYVAVIFLGVPALPSEVNDLIYLGLATATIGALASRHAARHRLRMATDRAEIRQSVIVVRGELQAVRSEFQASLAQILAAIDAHEHKVDKRDGLIYARTSRVLTGLADISRRIPEPDTAPIPQLHVAGGTAHVVATVPVPSNVTALPSPGTVEAMRRLAKKVTDAD